MSERKRLIELLKQTCHCKCEQALDWSDTE